MLNSKLNFVRKLDKAILLPNLGKINFEGKKRQVLYDLSNIDKSAPA